MLEQNRVFPQKKDWPGLGVWKSPKQWPRTSGSWFPRFSRSKAKRQRVQEGLGVGCTGKEGVIVREGPAFHISWLRYLSGRKKTPQSPHP